MNNKPRLDEIYGEMLEEGFFDRMGSRLKGFGAGAKQLGKNIKNINDPSKQKNIFKVAGNEKFTNLINNFIAKVKSEKEKLNSTVGNAINNYPELSSIYTNLDRTITGLEKINNPNNPVPVKPIRNANMEDTPEPDETPETPPLPVTPVQNVEIKAQTRAVDPDSEREAPLEQTIETPLTKAQLRAREAAALEAEIQANEEAARKKVAAKPVRKPIARPTKKVIKKPVKKPVKKTIKSSFSFEDAYDSLMGKVKVL